MHINTVAAHVLACHACRICCKERVVCFTGSAQLSGRMPSAQGPGSIEPPGLAPSTSAQPLVGPSARLATFNCSCQSTAKLTGCPPRLQHTQLLHLLTLLSMPRKLC